jgi:hypothetical protein
MVLVPYFALVFTALVTASIGASAPKSISRRRFFYCSVKNDAYTNGTILFSISCLALVVLYEVWTMVLLYKRWKYLRQKCYSVKSPIDLPFVVRTLAFGVYILLDLCLGIVSFHAPAGAIPDLAFATSASAVVLIFGSQRDILRALCFWRKEQPKVVDEQTRPEEVTDD